MMDGGDPLTRAFTPWTLGGVRLRNRIIKTATYEGMTPGGVPSEALIGHHEALARGGVGMTTVAYCSVSDEGRTFGDQLFMHAAARPGLRALTARVHEAGAAVSLQLGHAGGFSKHRAGGRWAVPGPSRGVNPYGLVKGLGLVRPLQPAEMEALADDFAAAAVAAVEDGFDAVELHLGHGYLLSQFLSPALNRRRDGWGGDVAGRLRFPLLVVERVRAAMGARAALLAKVNLDDGVAGGAGPEEAAVVARALERAGVDALVLSGGLVSRSAMFLMRGERPLRAMIAVERHWLQKAALALLGPLLVKAWPYEELFFLEAARVVRAAVQMPLVLLGGVASAEGLRTAMAEGFELVAMGRALIADPGFVARLERGEVTRSACTHCNLCITEMDRPSGVRCVLPEAQAP